MMNAEAFSAGANGSSAPQPRRLQIQHIHSVQETPIRQVPIPEEPDDCPLNKGLSCEKKAGVYLQRLGTDNQNQLKRLIIDEQPY